MRRQIDEEKAFCFRVRLKVIEKIFSQDLTGVAGGKTSIYEIYEDFFSRFDCARAEATDTDEEQANRNSKTLIQLLFFHPFRRFSPIPLRQTIVLR